MLNTLQNTIQLWWDALDLPMQIFYGVGILALFAVFLQGVLVIFGIGEGDHFSADAGGLDGGLDAGMDGGPGDAAGGYTTGSFLSFRGLSAFALGFGWAGAIGHKLGLTALLAALAGIAAGLAIEVTFLWMMRQVSRLQSDGTFRLSSAIGGVGTVYLTVPPKGQGAGEVILRAAGRSVHCKAYNDSPTPCKSGAEVTVKGQHGTAVLVAPLDGGV